MENKNKKSTLTVIGISLLFVVLIGVTYSFFNYTRIGSDNKLTVGRISFNHQETDTINLTNVFPVKKEELATNQNFVDEVIIYITGDTTYNDGIEYLVSATNVTNTVNSKQIPIGINVTVENNSEVNGATIGTADDNYFDNRGGNTSIYNIRAKKTIKNEDQLVVGYIAKGSTGVDGIVTIQAFIDGDKIAISDTYDGTESDINGTTTEWVNGRVVLTEEEWNSLNNSGVSFKVKVEANEGIWVKRPPNAYEEISKNVNSPIQIDFKNISSDSNGKGLYLYTGTENDDYPIYYYRGEIDNNNVIFGGFCWQIVRTTNTGGIKMIYNGVSTGDGKTCENVSNADRTIYANVAFNTKYTSISDAGYMYNARYAKSSGKAIDDAYFGNGFEYGDFDSDGNNEYRLIAEEAVTTLDNNHHYTCNSTDINATCTEIRYYYFYYYMYSTSTYNYISLTNGEAIEDALYKMTGNGSDEVKARNAGYILNSTSSIAKGLIESWFIDNLTNDVDETKNDYQKYLEDTIFCNDRSYKNDTNPFQSIGLNPNGGNISNRLNFSRIFCSWYSTTKIPVLSCPNITDSFSVSNNLAKLSYPVGLLTSDEVVLAGASGNWNMNNTSYYLYTNGNYWTMTPADYNVYGIELMYVRTGGTLYDSPGYPTENYGLRPVISLKFGVEFNEDGDGTKMNPYVVKYN